MRPLEITINGLRSHLGSTSIKFPDDWQLTAVVGPTGAGKSSLLEAMVYALFGSGTVPNASQPINLIADDAREMRVLMKFEVAGVAHQIVRTYRRAGSSPLPTLTAPGRTVTGASQVTEAIQRVLGMSRDVYCQTALLPQGRFARLLEAGPAEQKNTLDEFFRLSEVTDIAGRIADAADKLDQARMRVADARQQLPKDATTNQDIAERALDQAQQAAQAAADLEAAVDELLAQASAADGRAKEHERRARELSEASSALEAIADDATAIAGLATELRRLQEEAVAVLEACRGAHETARDRLAMLDAPAVAQARSALRALDTRIAEARAADDVEQDRHRVADAARQAFESLTTGLMNLEESHERLKGEAVEANRIAVEAEAHVRRGEALANRAITSGNALAEVEGRVRTAESDARTAATGLEEAEAALERARVDVDAAKERDGTARNLKDSADATWQAADLHLNTIRSRGEAVADALAEVNQARDALVSATEHDREAQDSAEAVRSERDSASAKLKGLQSELAEVRRSNAAAVAAAGCRPGDECPVCRRELPVGFEITGPAHSVEEIEAKVDGAQSAYSTAVEKAAQADERARMAEQQRMAAQGALDACVRAHDDAEALYDEVGGRTAEAGATQAVSDATRAVKDASGEVVAAQAALAAAEATFIERSTGIDAFRNRATNTRTAAESVAAALRVAEQVANEASEEYLVFGGEPALAAAREDEQRAKEAATEAQRVANVERDQLAELVQRHANQQADVAAKRALAEASADQARQARDAVATAALDVPLIARDAAGDDPILIREAAEQWTSHREAELASAKHAASDAERDFESACSAVDTLDQRLANEHDVPLARVIARAAASAVTVGAGEPPTAEAAELADWARNAISDAESQVADELGVAEREQATASHCRSEADSLCERAGITIDRIESWRTQLDEIVGMTRNRVEIARKVSAQCTMLDHALKASAKRANVLQAGKALSRGQGNFVLHVLSARRRQLLIESAAILDELSGGRLAFDSQAIDKFSVKDNRSGVARDPRLLSGGEQFQASLALALGLVEIAARGGSRIECLFLDEGFGALDSQSLDIALDALEAAARRGRRIVAVTHVEAVSARCDQIIEVRPTPGGSRVAWRDTSALVPM